MIVFGTRGVKSTIKSGDFHCPQCQQRRSYRHRKVRRFFTLYFIPLIPLGKASEYVECESCKASFISRILDTKASKKEELRANYDIIIKRSMVLVLLAGNIININEKRVQVIIIINSYSNHSLSMFQLEAYIEMVKKENEDITTYLKKVSPFLTAYEKEMIIKCALSVVAVDEDIASSEFNLISEMAKSLKMPKAHLNGILSEFHEI